MEESGHLFFQNSDEEYEPSQPVRRKQARARLVNRRMTRLSRFAPNPSGVQFENDDTSSTISSAPGDSSCGAGGSPEQPQQQQQQQQQQKGGPHGRDLGEQALARVQPQFFPRRVMPMAQARTPREPRRSESRRLPVAFPAQPPGSWIGGDGASSFDRRRPDDRADAYSEAQPQAGGQSVHLVKAVRNATLRIHRGAPITSLTINQIPVQMRRSQVAELLDTMGFGARYDYLHVPSNHAKFNQGHAFVNFCSAKDAQEFFSVWHGARVVGVGRDAPIIFVSVSTVQGFEASVKQWTVAQVRRLRDPDLRPFIAGLCA